MASSPLNPCRCRRAGTVALLLASLATGVPACAQTNATAPFANDPFAPSIDWPTGLPTRALAVLDDTSARVALAFAVDAGIGLLDLDDGALQPSAAAVGSSPMSVTAFATGGGPRALALVSAGDATLSVLAPTATDLSAVATAELDLRPKHVCAADLDADGRDELVVTLGFEGEAGAGVEVWRFDGASLARVGPRWTIDGAFATTTGDVDGDGDPDVVAVLPSAGAIAWAVVDGADGLREAGRRVLCDAPRAVAMVGSRIAVACRDGLAVAGIGGDTPIERIPIDGNPYDVVAGDLDGDGRTDLAAVDQANDSVVVTAGLAGDRWSRPIVHPVGGDPVALVAADLGGDGDLDLVVSAFETRTIDVLENLSSP